MDMPGNRWSYYKKLLFSSKRAVSVLVVVLLFLAIPLTVFVVQLQQEIRQRAQEQNTVPVASTVTYPWDNPRSGQRLIPQVDASKKAIFAQLPFSSKTCEKKKEGDADCNDTINLADLSYWQIDYEKDSRQYADFNGDGKVTLIDYTIWRAHADIPTMSFVQKLSQKLGLEKLFAQTIWSFTPKITRVFAQETGSSTVTESSVIIASDEYRVMNQYADQTYSIEEIESGSTGGQVVYYSSSGVQTAQVNNFVGDNSTMTTSVGGANVAVNRNEQGVVAQTSKDANGGFIANQVWADTAAYTQNAAPQAATLPTSSGFATLSIQPNGAGIFTQTDTTGKVIGKAVMEENGMVTNVTPGYTSIADGTTGLSLSTVTTKDADISMLFFGRKLLGMMKKAKNSSLSLAFVQSNGSWQFTTLSRDGSKTENTIANVTQQSDPNFPELTQILQAAKDFRATRSYNNTGFTGAFLNSDDTSGQARAANQIIAAIPSTAVLGAKTKVPTKSVLGTENIPLASPISLPGGTATAVQVVTSTWTDDQGTHYAGHTQLVGTNTKGEQGQPVADPKPIEEIVSRPGAPAEPPSAQAMAAEAASSVGGSVQGQDNSSGQQTATTGTAFSTSAGQSGTFNTNAAGTVKSITSSDFTITGTRQDGTVGPISYTLDYKGSAGQWERNYGEERPFGHNTSKADVSEADSKAIDAATAQAKSDNPGSRQVGADGKEVSIDAVAPAAPAVPGNLPAGQTGNLSSAQIEEAAKAAGTQAAGGITGNAPLSGIAAGWAAYTTATQNGMSSSEALALAQSIGVTQGQSTGHSTSDLNAITEALSQFANSERGIDAPVSWDTISNAVDVSSVEGANAALATAVASEAIQDGQRDIAAENLSATTEAYNRGEATIEQVMEASAALDQQLADVAQAEATTEQAQANLDAVSSSETTEGSVNPGAPEPADGGGTNEASVSVSESYSDNSQGSVDSNSNNGSY